MIGQNHELVVKNPSVQIITNQDNQESLNSPAQVNKEEEDIMMDVDNEREIEVEENFDEEPDPSTDIECVSKTITLSITDPLIGGQGEDSDSLVTPEEIESLVRRR